MKTFMISFLLLAIASSGFAYVSGIAIQTEKGSNIQVLVNGKLYNKHPENFVRIRSTPGLFHLEIKAYNPHEKRWQIVKKDVRLQRGYDFYYRVIFSKNHRPELREVKRYPIYSKYFLNPALYNRHPIS